MRGEPAFGMAYHSVVVIEAGGQNGMTVSWYLYVSCVEAAARRLTAKDALQCTLRSVPFRLLWKHAVCGRYRLVEGCQSYTESLL